MKLIHGRLRRSPLPLKTCAALIPWLLLLGACGGGGGTPAPESNANVPATECIPGDPATSGECGTLLLGVHLYGDFGEFVDALALELDGATTLRSLHARGRYDAAANVFAASRIGARLLAR